MNKEKLLIIDGSSLLSTSFYGTVPKTYHFAKTNEDFEKILPKLMCTKDGLYTNGMYPFFKVLEKIINTQEITHLVIAWDKTRDTFRRKIYPEYKANRSETRPELKLQFDQMQKALKYMGVKQFVFDEYEADDIIGTISKNTNMETYILTKDNDALQLIDETTKVWLITSKAKDIATQLGLNLEAMSCPDNTFEFNQKSILEYHKLLPRQIIDLKALEGDASDNIPGVKGIGKKSALGLIQEFGSLEGILDYLSEITDNGEDLKVRMKDRGVNRNPYKYLKEDIENNNLGILSKHLATIKLDIEELSEVTNDDLLLNIDNFKKNKMYERLEMKSLIV